jgi:SM-20-related protein
MFDYIAQALESPGYIVLPDVFPAALITDLLQHVRSLDESRLHPAGIGRDTAHQVNQLIRSDKILWLDEPVYPSELAFLDWIEQLRLVLNRRLFLGLFDYECHYAYYPPGAFYKKHRDAFHGRSSRIVSTVLYLNPQWHEQDGGELLLYEEDKNDAIPVVRVLPHGGSLVLFLSEQFPHEVTPVRQPRYSIAGWFRVNSR